MCIDELEDWRKSASHPVEGKARPSCPNSAELYRALFIEAGRTLHNALRHHGDIETCDIQRCSEVMLAIRGEAQNAWTVEQAEIG